ncbi:MAG: hypothetical protein LDL33_00080 [Desulfomonile sp.]|nr:hypothetical protein [Desulfomonile sp.]
MLIRIIGLIACLMLVSTGFAFARETPAAEAEETPDVQPRETQEAQPEDLPPGKVRIAFEPARPQSGDRLKLRVGLGERTFWAIVHWKLNGVPAGETRLTRDDKQAQFPGRLAAGDVVEATVVPFSSFSVEGEPASVRVTVTKAPPDLKLVSQEISSGVYRAVVKAQDAEGGPISLALKEAPQGMTISRDGKITWRFAPNTFGRFNVVVSAKDKSGCETVLSYSFAMRRPGQ